MSSLWGAEFEIEDTKTKAGKILAKTSKPKKTKAKKQVNCLEDNLQLIRENVNLALGKYADNTVLIKSREELFHYFEKARQDGIIAVDTETNKSLDPITCKIMGLCIYSPGQKAAYVPINHVFSGTENRIEWQCTEEDIYDVFTEYSDVPIVMHNGKFDYEVIKCTCGVELRLDWDTMVGARLLDENERAGLKGQYADKIDPSVEKYNIETFFKKVNYEDVDPETFALYAATDAYMTYKLYEYQKEQFNRPENARLYDLFKNVELPVFLVAAEMELTGIAIDKDYAEKLSKKYNARMEEVDKRIEELISTEYSDKISKWRLTEEANYRPITKAGKEGKSKNEQLQDPISITSPVQLAILIYDVLKYKGDNGRGTGEGDLKKLTKQGFELGDLILEKRGLKKLLSTYIDKLPTIVNEKTGRLHGHFNTLGTDTGRFSSTEPNLQNIPSHEKSIRMMFTAEPGNVMVGSDFSQQEPRLLAHYANDEAMINAYLNKRDLYATVASIVYNNDYWDNMEHLEDGTANPEGKKRRSNMKSVVLGLLYGRGTNSVAEQIGTSYQEAQDIIDRFFAGFPTVKNWIQNTQEDAYKNGYVEDVMGRRRRLPDLKLPAFEVEDLNAKMTVDFNPLLNAAGKRPGTPNPRVEYYRQQLLKKPNRNTRVALENQAAAEGIKIQNNTGFISRAERQCVNARVQGGASTITKLAMISVSKDKELKDLGFKLLLCIHDELIGECPRENAEQVASRLTRLMIEAAALVCKVPMKCDAEITSRWYLSDFGDTVKATYDKMIAQGMSKDEAWEKLKSDNIMIKESYLHEMADGTFDYVAHDDI